MYSMLKIWLYIRLKIALSQKEQRLEKEVEANDRRSEELSEAQAQMKEKEEAFATRWEETESSLHNRTLTLTSKEEAVDCLG